MFFSTQIIPDLLFSIWQAYILPSRKTNLIKLLRERKPDGLSQLLYIDFRMLLQHVFRILQPETGYPFAECHFIRSLDISGKIGTVGMKHI